MPLSELPEPFKKIVRPLYYFTLNIKLALHHLVWRNKSVEYKEIPIIINNFNRLTCLRQLIEALAKRGYFNIHIIDNASTYPPLLEYYQHCPYKVHKLDQNIGYLALWKSPVFKLFRNQYYVYTDSDVIPVDECPDDFMKFFFQKLTCSFKTLKVGFSLKIDDLPDHFKMKRQVLKFEEAYFHKKENDGFYKANIDTTFALYKPGVKGGANLYRQMFRSPYPYEARHMPWYIDSEKINGEELYYISSVKQSTHWSALLKY